MSDNKELYLSVFNQMNKNAADEIAQINNSHLAEMTVLMKSHNDVELSAQQVHERNMQTINSNHTKNIAALDGARSAMYSNHEAAMLAIADNRASQMAAIETVATKLRKARIADILRQVRRSRNVQLCFVVDATGSMQSHINSVKSSIHEIVRKLTDAGPRVSFKDRQTTAQKMMLAFVAYRDLEDSNQFEILNFTESADTFKTFCDGIRASGGADECEDVFGGLEKVLDLNWSPNFGTKVLFHICDAPCHGREFHNGCNDSHSSGDPKGRTCTKLFSQLREKGIQYHFGKINSTTDIMVRRFEEAYGDEVAEFDVKNVNAIRMAVITAVAASVVASAATKMRPSGRSHEMPHIVLDRNEPDWRHIAVVKGTLVSYECPRSIQGIIDDIPLQRNEPKAAGVKIAPKPFGKGAERMAFFGMDVGITLYGTDISIAKDEKIVLKQYIIPGKGTNSARRYEISNQMQTVAAFLASKFAKEVETHARTRYSIKFIKIKTLAIGEGSDRRYMSCERRFSSDDKYIRFTNNVDYSIMEENAASLGVPLEYVDLLIAFSHWTHKVSDGFFMVVDLQGVVTKTGAEKGVHLTDPAIHCMNLSRFGPMNHGIWGMNKFFKAHICNRFCKSLGLETFVPKKLCSDVD